jgi:hypothetical protein
MCFARASGVMRDRTHALAVSQPDWARKDHGIAAFFLPRSRANFAQGAQQAGSFVSPACRRHANGVDQ